MKKINKILIVLILMLFVSLLTGCTNDDEKVDVYASIYPVYYLAKNIAGEKLTVRQVYPNGADVHEYDPISDGDMKSLVKMNDAKLMLYLNDNLEAFIKSAKNSVFKGSDIKLVELTESIRLYDAVTEEYEITDEHSTNADLHIWLDPTMMMKVAKIIEKELVAIDSENELYYETNLNELIDTLDKIDRKYQEELSKFEFKTMLVDHDAYLYLAKRYGITRIKSRIDNESCDISASHMIEVIEQARELDIKYIVVTRNESVCSSVETFNSELGCEIVYLDPISTLTKETEDSDFYELMISNLYVLKKIFR